MPNPQAETPVTTKNGICVKCRRELPGGNFKADPAGNPSAWCNACRSTAKAKWDVEEDLVEATYSLFAFEQGIKAEISVLTASREAAGEYPPGTKETVAVVMRNLDGLKHHRIASSLKAFLAQYRRDYFKAVGVDLLETWTSTDPEI